MFQSEKFCLKWNDFHSNVSKSFSLLRNENYLHDVTLVSDDEKQMSAHKLVLSACSEYFKNIFKKHKSPSSSNMLICLTGVSSNYLENILEYMYNGEVQIYQNDLDPFLEIAQKLKLAGLISEEKIEEELPEYREIEIPEPVKTNTSRKVFLKEENESSDKIVKLNSENIMINSNDLDEIDEQLFHHMEKIGSAKYECKICNKVIPHKTKMKLHIEKHMDGLSFPCELCGKTFRSRNSFNMHKSQNHKQ